MADTRPTKLKFPKIIHLCFLAFFKPKQFIEEENKDNALRNDSSSPKKKHNIYVVRKALLSSLGLIVLSAILGAVVGLFLRDKLNNPTEHMVSLLQIAGACLILWGTFFVRGWEIQTWGGENFTERFNRWIYRTLCFLGTSIIICSLVWTIKQCDASDISAL